MKNIDFKVSVEDVIRFLGIENFESKNSALYELVKNCYDAEATNCNIFIENDKLVIVDNGSGMNEKDIMSNWMHIGISKKRNVNINNGRVLTGDKGIGRLAISRLGSNCVIKTKKQNCAGIKWITDWSSTSFEVEENIENGTRIEISKLEDNWRDVDVKNLITFLSLMINSSEMIINVHFNGEVYKIDNVFLNIQPLVNYFLNFSFNIEDSKIHCTYDNKILEPKMMAILKVDEYGEKNIDTDIDLAKLEGVSGEFYYGFKVLNDAKADFSYRCSPTDYSPIKLMDKNINGVVLYRDHFSLNGFDGTNDWLKLNRRSSSANKAFSDPSGHTAFKYQNITGFINISKIKNGTLVDLSNRQGVIKNETYFLLIDVVHKVFFNIEKMIKEQLINARNYNMSVVANFVNKNEDVHIHNLNKGIKKFRTSNSRGKIKLLDTNPDKFYPIKQIIDLEYNIDILKDDTFHLQNYSTLSLLMLSQIHDLKNELKTVGHTPTLLREILKDNIDEEALINNTKSLKSYKQYEQNIDKLTLDGKKLQDKLIHYFDGVQKSKYYIRDINIVDYFRVMSDFYNSTYGTLKLNCNSNLDVVKFDEITLDIIFNNLIINSVKHNEGKKIEVYIDLLIHDESILISYHDTGNGLDDKYKDDPNAIFKLGETSIESSTGLGLWIVKKRVDILEGEINLENRKGFCIKIKLGVFK